jgi:hypothetical protein
MGRSTARGGQECQKIYSKHNGEEKKLNKKRNLSGDMEEGKNHTDHETRHKTARTLPNTAQ